MSDDRCPACGSAMFGWASASPRPAYAPGSSELVIDRCEACGLGVAAQAGSIEWSALLGDPDQVEGPNRASLQAALGARGWAAIAPGRRLYPTPAAAEALAGKLGGRAVRVRTPPNGAAIWGMWQTLVNAFTLGDNVISDAWGGRQAPAGGRKRAALGLDLVVSALVALPLLVVAVVLEGAASVTGRGGIVRFRIER